MDNKGKDQLQASLEFFLAIHQPQYAEARQDEDFEDPILGLVKKEISNTTSPFYANSQKTDKKPGVNKDDNNLELLGKST